MNPRIIWKWLTSAMGALAVVTLVYVLIVLSDGLPTLEELENPRQDLATQVMSADGELLAHYAATRRTYIPFDSLPKSFVDALIATEDRAFYDHWGVHTFRIFKAAVKNVFAMRTKEGASTLTQQLALNLYFERERTLARKIREAYTAFQIEQTYTKNEILEMYANTVYYGKGAYGIREAAHAYFNKEPRELTIAQSAYLVGLFKAPERYNRNDSLGVGRRNLILGMMRDEGYLSADAWAQASTEPLIKVPPEQITRGIAPHFVEVIRQKLSPQGEWNDLLQGRDLYRDGLVITTTLHSKVQKYANDAVAEHLQQYQVLFDQSWSWTSRRPLLSDLLNRAASQHPTVLSADKSARKALKDRLLRQRSFVDSVKRMATLIQMGVVVVDIRSGAILGMVGASPLAIKLDPAGRYSLNHVTQIKRQPGSAFKPFVYTAAVEAGLTADSLIESGPYSYLIPETGAVWAPRGASKNGGPMPLRTALKFSTNTVAARLVTQVTTPGAVVDVCRRMGITSQLTAVPSIALGAVEVSPIELVTAYIPFANQGVAVPPAYITKIEDRMGNVLYEARLPRGVHDAIGMGTANQMVSMMRGVVDGGTGSRVRRYFKGEAAGKTGTTNDFADAWFVGYTPRLVAGVWTGFDDRRITFTGDYGQGGRAAAPVWGRLMGWISSDRSLAFREDHFPVASDSLDVITPEAIADPPSEQIQDDTPEIGPPQPPSNLPTTRPNE